MSDASLVSGVTRKYVTAAQADEMRKTVVALGWPDSPSDFRETMRMYGVEYYIVPDDDPRVGGDALRTEA